MRVHGGPATPCPSIASNSSNKDSWNGGRTFGCEPCNEQQHLGELRHECLNVLTVPRLIRGIGTEDLSSANVYSSTADMMNVFLYRRWHRNQR